MNKILKTIIGNIIPSTDYRLGYEHGYRAGYESAIKIATDYIANQAEVKLYTTQKSPEEKE